MLRSLGITTIVKYFVLVCIAVAIWQAFDGNIGAIVTAVWNWIQAGADVVTRIWESVNANTGKGR